MQRTSADLLRFTDFPALVFVAVSWAVFLTVVVAFAAAFLPLLGAFFVEDLCEEEYEYEQHELGREWMTTKRRRKTNLRRHRVEEKF